jgi:Family of unknown function (DUF6317)
MSGDDFQVLMSDLLVAAGVFQQESAALSNVIPPDGPTVRDGGGADVNHAMQAAASTLGTMNAQLAGAINQHATDLHDAHTTYANSEGDIAKLAYEIRNPDPI